VLQLRAMCRKRGLKVGGSKADLIARLEAEGSNSQEILSSNQDIAISEHHKTIIPVSAHTAANQYAPPGLTAAPSYLLTEDS